MLRRSRKTRKSMGRRGFIEQLNDEEKEQEEEQEEGDRT